jgi:hypothetical protein
MNKSLQVFAERVLAKGRIAKRDVQDLQRNCLADGLMSREEAEILIRLDREAGTLHASWSAYFIATLTDFVVWGSRPTGAIDSDTAHWLAGALTGTGESPRAPRLIAELMSEAQDIDEALLAVAGPAALSIPQKPSACGLVA